MYSKFHGELQNNKYVDEILREYFSDYNYKGVFFDVGAFEPIKISNSYHFETNGWKTYCFEANRDLIYHLKQYRKNVYNYAISNENLNNVEFNIVNTDNLTASYSAIEISEEYKKQCGWDDNWVIKKINVPQKTLNNVIENEIQDIFEIDILSIDVEGGELNVLKGLDLIKYKPKIILVENVCHTKDIENYLLNFNYKLDKINEYNYFFKFHQPPPPVKNYVYICQVI
jgi:FkbM family methyltransferase